MKTHTVAHVNEVSTLRFDPIDDVKRLVKAHMREMSTRSQRVNDQQRYILETFNHLITDDLSIGDISKRTYAETDYRQVIMHHGKRFNLNPLDHKRLIANYMFLKAWHTGIWIIGKTIRDVLMQILQHVGTGIEGEGLFTTIGPQVIESCHMVKVDMRQEDCIQIIVAGTQHLCAEIRTAINQ